MTDLKDLSKELNSIVPDLYYDLISRVVPGTFILTIMIGLLKGWEFLLNIPHDINIGSATVFIIAIATIGYLVGMLCLPIGEAIRYLWTPLLWRAVVASSRALVLKVEKEFDLPQLHSSWSTSRINLSYRIIHAKLRATGQNVVLSKMQAESAQGAVLVGFFSLLLAARAFENLFPAQTTIFLSRPSVLWVGTIGFVLSLVTSMFRGFRLWTSHLSKLHDIVKNESEGMASRATAT